MLGLLALRISSFGPDLISRGIMDDAGTMVPALAWILKGMAMQRRPKRSQLSAAMDAYAKFLDASLEVAMEAAAGFGVIIGSDEDFQGPSTSPIFRQRFFMSVYPKLQSAYAASPRESRRSYVLAMTLLFESVNFSTLMEHIVRRFLSSS